MSLGALSDIDRLEHSVVPVLPPWLARRLRKEASAPIDNMVTTLDWRFDRSTENSTGNFSKLSETLVDSWREVQAACMRAF